MASGAFSSDTALSVIAICTTCSLALGEGILHKVIWAENTEYRGFFLTHQLFSRRVEWLERAFMGTRIEVSVTVSLSFPFSNDE